MQVIFGRETANQVAERYTVLELETFHANGKDIPTFCVVPADRIPLHEAATVEDNKTLHQEFIDSYNLNKYQTCIDLYPRLKGLWGQELDSFYDAILEKCSSIST